MNTIIKNHTKKYPLMTNQDVVKLIYQNEFGCGHFVKDEKSSLELIKKEFKNRVQTENLFEDIGNGYVRFYISALKDDNFDAELINRLFIFSASKKDGTIESLLEKLEPYKNDEYVKDYIKNGCPMVSHSNGYRSAYNPAYRVMKAELASLYELLFNLKKLADKKDIVVSFDGRAAAGKTTAAKICELVLGAKVIHADDFFLPFDMRTENRLNEAGGNIHYERLKSEVIDNLNKDKLIYGKYDCAVGKITESIGFKKGKITIIEGAYSSHPYFGDIYDYRVFFDIDDKLQEDRILKRNGAQMLAKFKTSWIPMENRYIETFCIDKKSDYKTLGTLYPTPL